MSRNAFLSMGLLFLACQSVNARGVLIPEDKTLPPLAMVHHQVEVTIKDQIAVTRVEQSFRNHTNRQLEATYLFAVPKGASVNKFSMWVDGKEVSGEMVEAKKAAEIYTHIVRQTQDPGLLEYIGTNALRLRVFPVMPKADQKVALSFTSVVPQDHGINEYVYPLRTDGKANQTLEKFSVRIDIQSQHPIQNVYSPTHAITTNRRNDKDVRVHFERNQAYLDRDFQLLYTLGNKEIGITPLLYRPIAAEKGYFMLLISPELQSAKAQVIPRDMVFVLDTSGSMAGVKLEQAKKALHYLLSNLGSQDRFALINFGNGVDVYRDNLVEASSDYLANGKKWVDGLKATGGTNISGALETALGMRPKQDEGRPFTIIFFTDGQPSIGIMQPEKILKEVSRQNTASTRIFTFGVGDDVNASLLDQLAEQTKALSTYVRPEEDISEKVAGLYSRISHPVLANVKLRASDNVSLSEMYPTALPDLFFGQQLVVVGRYSGQGPTTLTLSGTVGQKTKSFTYEVPFAEKTGEERDVVEHVWARRKVGFMLDQIRLNGENRELVDEVMTLSKKYGIATPYTSYLVVPDLPMPVIGGFRKREDSSAGPHAVPILLRENGKTGKTTDLLKDLDAPPKLSAARDAATEKAVADATSQDDKWSTGQQHGSALQQIRQQKEAFARAKKLLNAGQANWKNLTETPQAGRLGVDLSIAANTLRNQERFMQTAVRQANGRQCLDVGGVWIDERFEEKMPILVVKAQSDAYFRILQRHPKMKDVFRLGNHLVWVTPNQTALVVDRNDGRDQLSDKEIDVLFVAK